MMTRVGPWGPALIVLIVLHVHTRVGQSVLPTLSAGETPSVIYLMYLQDFSPFV